MSIFGLGRLCLNRLAPRLAGAGLVSVGLTQTALAEDAESKTTLNDDGTKTTVYAEGTVHPQDEVVVTYVNPEDDPGFNPYTKFMTKEKYKDFTSLEDGRISTETYLSEKAVADKRYNELNKVPEDPMDPDSSNYDPDYTDPTDPKSPNYDPDLKENWAETEAWEFWEMFEEHFPEELEDFDPDESSVYQANLGNPCLKEIGNALECVATKGSPWEPFGLLDICLYEHDAYIAGLTSGNESVQAVSPMYLSKGADYIRPGWKPSAYWDQFRGGDNQEV